MDTKQLPVQAHAMLQLNHKELIVSFFCVLQRNILCIMKFCLAMVIWKLGEASERLCTPLLMEDLSYGMP